MESWGIPWPPPKGWKKLLLEEGIQTNDSKKVKNLEKRKAIRQRRKEKRKAKKGHSALGFKNIKRQSGKWIDPEKYDKFYKSCEWRELRYLALKNTDGRCECCGAAAKDGVQLHVDHIKPRSSRPDLQLSLGNIQVLCLDCNIGKGAWDDTDWRSEAARHMDDITKH